MRDDGRTRLRQQIANRGIANARNDRRIEQLQRLLVRFDLFFDVRVVESALERGERPGETVTRGANARAHCVVARWRGEYLPETTVIGEHHAGVAQDVVVLGALSSNSRHRHFSIADGMQNTDRLRLREKGSAHPGSRVPARGILFDVVAVISPIARNQGSG